MPRTATATLEHGRDRWVCGDHRAVVEGGDPVAPDRAARALDALFTVARGSPVLAMDLAALGRSFGPEHGPEALLRAVRSGALRVWRLPPRTPRAPEVERPASEAQARYDAAVDAELTWIAVQLLDDEDPPRPVGYARYRLRTPDGVEREGRLDASGSARVDGIPGGMCELSFPDYDRGAWSKVATR